MNPIPLPTTQMTKSPGVGDSSLAITDLKGRWPAADRLLSRGTYICLVAFVFALPHSIAVTEIAYTGAIFLWLIRCIACRRSLLHQRLTWPLLAFLLLSAASTLVSFAPAESWAHMKK